MLLPVDLEKAVDYAVREITLGFKHGVVDDPVAPLVALGIPPTDAEKLSQGTPERFLAQDAGEALGQGAHRKEEGLCGREGGVLQVHNCERGGDQGDVGRDLGVDFGYAQSLAGGPALGQGHQGGG